MSQDTIISSLSCCQGQALFGTPKRLMQCISLPQLSRWWSPVCPELNSPSTLPRSWVSLSSFILLILFKYPFTSLSFRLQSWRPPIGFPLKSLHILKFHFATYRDASCQRNHRCRRRNEFQGEARVLCGNYEINFIEVLSQALISRIHVTNQRQ